MIMRLSQQKTVISLLINYPISLHQHHICHASYKVNIKELCRRMLGLHILQDKVCHFNLERTWAFVFEGDRNFNQVSLEDC